MLVMERGSQAQRMLQFCNSKGPEIYREEKRTQPAPARAPKLSSGGGKVYQVEEAPFAIIVRNGWVPISLTQSQPLAASLL